MGSGVVLTSRSQSRPAPHSGDLVIGPRYSPRLGHDAASGRYYVDTALTDSRIALKVDGQDRPFVETDPEPQALAVGLDGARPFYEKD
jgi:hypothetical protein